MKESYGSLSETINGLKKEGCTTDCNITNLSLKCNETNAPLSPADFKIDKVYRIEDSSNPDDQYILYAISSPNFSLKGLLVNGYGISADGDTDALITESRTHPE